MRKLKLQMQTSIDGFVARPNGELDWMLSGQLHDEVGNLVNELIDSSDTILMGRKMTDEFVNYWTKAVENPENPEYTFAKKCLIRQKLFLQKHLTSQSGQIRCWQNATL